MSLNCKECGLRVSRCICDTCPTVDAPVKSDGGSSSYYSFPITNAKGETIHVETKDVIRCMVGNDFDLGNIIKACRRIHEKQQGRGKAGTSIDYDANKIIFFANEVKTNAIH